ncbi:MAG: hypothetical protein ACP5KW_07965 [Thermoproteota archaeon]|jgi:hypothetical protein
MKAFLASLEVATAEVCTARDREMVGQSKAMLKRNNSREDLLTAKKMLSAMFFELKK